MVYDMIVNGLRKLLEDGNKNQSGIDREGWCQTTDVNYLIARTSLVATP